MPSQLFPPSPNREAAMQALREGMSPAECAVKYALSPRTIYRYLNAMQLTLPRKQSRQVKAASAAPIKITIEMAYAEFVDLLAQLGQEILNDD